MKRVLVTLLLLIVLNAPLLGWMASQAGQLSADEKVYGLQLHLHGSLSEGPGSMRGHNQMAAMLNGAVDVLWWTDHDWRIAAYTYVSGFDFEEDLATAESVPARGRGEQTARIAWERQGIDVELRDLAIGFPTDPPPPLGARSMRLSARAPETAGADWRRLEYLLQTDASRDIAALASRVRLGLSLYPHDLGANARVVLRANLSQHAPDFRSRIEYVFSTDPAAADGVANSVATIDDPDEDLPVRLLTRFVRLDAGRWNNSELELSADAERFDLGGEDNSLVDTSLSFEARRGAALAVQIDAYRIERPLAGQGLLDHQRDLVAGMPGDLVNHVGIEISYDVHMTAYGMQVPIPDFSEYPNGLTFGRIVDFVHGHAGIVSLAHAFGPGGRAGIRDHTQGREQARFERIRDSVVENRAYGGDLLEVGYVERYYGIEAFLDLWDRLSQAGVFITGVGVSDSHDNLRYWTTGPNNFITWVHSTSSGEADLIAALKSGRAFFGNPKRFDGVMDITTPDGARMGEIALTGGAKQTVRYSARGLEAGMTVRIIHNGAAAGEHVTAGETFRFEETVDSSVPLFVRFEVWDGRSPIAFSNPLYLVPSSAGLELPAHRLTTNR